VALLGELLGGDRAAGAVPMTTTSHSMLSSPSSSVAAVTRSI